MKKFTGKKSLKLFYASIVMFTLCFTILINCTVLAGQDKVFPEGTIDTDKTEWTIKFKGKIDKKSINQDTLYVINEYTNEKISCSYSFPNESTVIIKPKSDLIANEIYSIIVTDKIKDINNKYIKSSAKKSFNVKKAKKISEIGTIDRVTVLKGQEPVLPKQVEVIYNDHSIGYVDVTWNSIKTNTVGVKKVSGKIENSKLKPTIEVEVLDMAYIYNTDLEYYPYLGAYKVKVNVSPEIYSVTLDGKKMDYEGDNTYSLTTILKSGKNITIKGYDVTNTLLDTRTRTVN